MKKRHILIEGFTPDELMTLPEHELEALILINEPIVFKAGSAEILGKIYLKPNTLVVELAQIDGGGKGILPSLWLLAGRYAQKRQLQTVEWLVHAVNCAQPNPKLQRILEKKGFQVQDLPETGEVYRFRQEVHSPKSRILG